MFRRLCRIVHYHKIRALFVRQIAINYRIRRKTQRELASRPRVALRGLISFASTYRMYVGCAFFISYSCAFFFVDGINCSMTCRFRNGITFLFMHSFAFSVCYRFTFSYWHRFARLIKVCLTFLFIHGRTLLPVDSITLL